MGELPDSSTVEAALQRAASCFGDPYRSLVIEVRCSPQGRLLATIVDQQQVSRRDDCGFAVVIRELPGDPAVARRGLEALGFTDESDCGGDRFVAVCGPDPVRAGQVLQAALIDVLGLPAGEPPIARLIDGGVVTPLQRLERRIIRAAVRQGAVVTDSAAIATFLERHAGLVRQRRELARRLEHIDAAAAELESLERELGERQADVGMIDARISRLAPQLGTAVFAAFLAGRVARTPEFEERIALEEQLERLRSEHDALAAAPDAGFLARASAVAQRLAVSGRIKIEELKIAGVDAALGKRLMEWPDPAALDAPETAVVLANVRDLRNQRQALLAERAAVTRRLDAARASFPAAPAAGPHADSRGLRAAAADCRRELNHLEGDIQSLEDQFVVHMVYNAAIVPGNELGDLVEELRDLKRAMSGPAVTPNQAPGPPPLPARGPGVLTPIARLASQTAAAVDQLREGVALPRTPVVVPWGTGSPTSVADSIVDPVLSGVARQTASPAAFQACRGALAAAGIPPEAVRLLFSCGSPPVSGSGCQYTHVAVTDAEWLVIPSPLAAAGPMIRVPMELGDWKLHAEQTGALAWSCGGVEGKFSDSGDVEFVIAAVGEAVLATARRLVSDLAYFRAETLLERIGADWPAAAAAGRMTAAIGRGPRVSATFRPQPAASDAGSPAAGIDGHLQFDSAGLEFVPAAFGAPGYLRVRAGAVLQFAVKPGQFPSAMVKAAKARRAGGTALKFATGFSRMMIDDPMLDMGTRIAGGAASEALSASADLGTRPNSRLVFLVEQDGTKRRLNFDMLGGTREEIERAAAAFCEQAEPFRERMGRRTVAPAVSVAPPTGETTTRVVGCPKCGARLRVAKPGVVGCPKCGTKVRISPDIFQRRPDSRSRPHGES